VSCVKQTGFSLIELIVVVVILGVLASGASLLIVQPVDAYRDQIRRQQLVDQGEMALRHVAREVRRALPNSIRATTSGGLTAVEIVNIVDGARYRDENATGLGDATDILDFSVADTSFNLLGQFHGLAGFAANHRIVIYNTSLAIYTSAAVPVSPGIVTPAGGLTLAASVNYPNETKITIPAFQFSQHSPGQRVFVIEDPVSYVCNPSAGTIVRYSGYGFSILQSTAPGGTASTVISKLSSCSMTYLPGTLNRGGIMVFELTIADGSENIDLFHQVHVVNVP
jgi:MSHA biogenesis protein MshO